MKSSIHIFLVLVFAGTFASCSDHKSSPADRYFEKGDYDQAAQTYTEQLKNNPSDVTLLYNRGRAYQEMGELGKAKEDFEKALNLEPNNFQVLLSMANVQIQQKNYAAALLYATQAEEISGAPAMASFLKGRALHQLGLAEDALKAYSNAIQLDDEFGQAYFNRGLLKLAMDRKKQACEDFKLAAVLEYPGGAETLKKYCK
jgi:tetratricopeptide (TPR) repeat protein